MFRLCVDSAWRSVNRGETSLPKKGRVDVEMLRVLPLRAYLALASARDREEGQALVEYALLLALIAVVSIAVLTVLGTKVSHIFSKISTDL
jgi:pilus assembly protein Flp/PilA